MTRKVTKEDMAPEDDGPTIIRKRITAERLLDKLEEELEACEQKVFNPKGNKDKKGLLYSKKMIEWGTRQKARMDAHKLRGDYPAEKSEVDVKLPNAMALVVQSRQEAKKKPKKKKNAK